MPRPAQLNVEYTSFDQLKAGVKKWVKDLHDVDDGEVNRAVNKSADLAAFITRVKSMNTTPMFDGLKLMMEFYALGQATPAVIVPGTPLADLFLRTQPIFRYGIRTIKSTMNRASGPNFMGTGNPISKQASYRNNAVIGNAANAAARASLAASNPAAAAAPQPEYQYRTEWGSGNWLLNGEGHPYIDGGRRRRTRRRSSRGRRSTARR